MPLHAQGMHVCVLLLAGLLLVRCVWEAYGASCYDSPLIMALPRRISQQQLAVAAAPVCPGKKHART